MKDQKVKKAYFTAGLFLLFILWTAAISYLDVKKIGPCGSSVGLAGLNKVIRDFIGVNMTLYNVTDILSIIPICFAAGFAILGLCQAIGRKSIFKVDRDLIILGGFYIAVIGVYLLFETLAVNYRPILINGHLEASYPSSTTLLVMCLMPTSSIEIQKRIKNKILNMFSVLLIFTFTVFMVTARFVSGVHWATDIIGGIILSSALVSFFSLLTFDNDNKFTFFVNFINCLSKN